ncbi:MAG: sulfur oxidation c-type cytochrome SoxA [Rubrivivax sp.]|nr:sulfur oxidation c-type cytochrome SoxA [Rubrivivax sp.]
MKAALLALAAVAVAAHAAGPRRSGYEDMSPSNRALQDDDSQNPALLWVQDGEQRFAAACARCHATGSLAGVAARYPAFDAALGKPVTLAQRIQLCHERHVKTAAPAAESAPLLALESHVARQSRGLPIAPPADPRLAPFRERGAQLFQQRLGQLGLACAQCHDGLAGRRLAGSLIPQGHPTGYPIYRLEWQGMGGLQRRLRGCLTGVRAEPFPYGSDEYTALELFLKSRAAGLRVDAPGVRP